MNNELFKIWKEAEAPIDYLVAIWIYVLASLATVGWVSLVYLLITEPEKFNSITFGIFDYV